MNITRHELDILICLMKQNDWVTSSSLADALDSNKKSIQQEIKYLSSKLKEQCVIVSNQRRGYYLEYLSKEIRKEIVSVLIYNEAHYSMQNRTSVLALFLLFQDDYVTMNDLTEKFYISKTTVFSEIKILKRWINRIHGLHLDVSNQWGIKIIGNEYARRYGCASFAQMNIVKQILLAEHWGVQYETYLESSKNTLRKYLKQNDFIISGEDFTRVVRYIAITILRSAMGYQLDDCITNASTDSLVTNILAEISAAVNYSFTLMEILEIQQRLLDSSIVNSDNEGTWETNQKVSELEAFIINTLKIPVKDLFMERELFTANVDQTLRRVSNGRKLVNYYDKNILSDNPLAVHLMNIGFKRIFQVKLPKPELTFLATHLAGELCKYEGSVNILLISNQNFYTFSTIKQNVSQAIPVKIKQFEIQPMYLYDRQNTNHTKYDLQLTTEPEMILEHDDFILVPVFFNKAKKHTLRKNLQLCYEDFIDRKTEAILEKYLYPVFMEKISGVYDYIKAHYGDQDMSDYTIETINDNLLLICLTGTHIETQIKFVTLETRCAYEHRDIKYILDIQCDVELTHVIDFFQAVAKIIKKYQ